MLMRSGTLVLAVGLVMCSVAGCGGNTARLDMGGDGSGGDHNHNDGVPGDRGDGTMGGDMGMGCTSSSTCPSNAPICDPTTHRCVPRGNGMNACDPPDSLTLAPADMSAMVSPGQMFSQSYTV